MEYRLMEISDLYEACIQQMDIDDLSYQEALQAVNEGCFFESDYIHRHFRDALHLETEIVYYGCKALQDKWDENRDKDSYSVLMRQIRAFRPDVLYISDISNFTRQQLTEIREALNGRVLLTCYMFTLINEHAKRVLPEYDLVFTGSHFSAEELRLYAKEVHVVRHAFEPTVLEKISDTDVVDKVGFIGSIMIGRNVHTNRIDMLSALQKKRIPFDFYGKVYGSFLNKRSFAEHAIHEPFKMADRIRMEKQLKQGCLPSKFGLEYYQCMKQYAVNLNIHAKAAGTGAGNMRMFEVTGIGSCLVTDYREENQLLFNEDSEIVVYKTPDEMSGKVKYLFDHPDEMRRIAENGQKRTLRDYNYRKKAAAIDSYIQKKLREG